MTEQTTAEQAAKGHVLHQAHPAVRHGPERARNGFLPRVSLQAGGRSVFPIDLSDGVSGRGGEAPLLFCNGPAVIEAVG